MEDETAAVAAECEELLLKELTGTDNVEDTAG